MINEKYVNFETNYGEFELNLDYLMLKNKISNYKLCVLTGIRYEVIVRYRLNLMQRYDRDVLAKICYVLDCKCDELITYNKNK